MVYVEGYWKIQLICLVILGLLVLYAVLSHEALPTNQDAINASNEISFCIDK